MNEKIKMIIILLVNIFAMSACTTQSVSDIYDITNIDEGVIKAGSEQNKKTETAKEFESETEETMSEISIREMNEVAVYRGVELIAEQAWVTNNLQFLAEIEGDSVCNEFVINELNAEKEEIVLDEEGKFVSGKYQWLFIRMKMKCQDETSDMKKIYIYPLFYKYIDQSGFSLLRAIEPCAFDQYENLTERSIYHKDALLYTFKDNEAIETIVVFKCKLNTPYDNLYMSTRFLDLGSSAADSEIPSDCPVIRISDIQRIDEE